MGKLDEKHLNNKASKICSSLFSRFEKLNASLFEKLQSFDKKNHITQKSKILLKNVDEKYGVSTYVNKLQSFEKVQIVSKSINNVASKTIASVEEIGQEIKSFEKKQRKNEDVEPIIKDTKKEKGQ